MTVRAYLASPYRSHVCWNMFGRHAPIRDAMKCLLSLSHKLRPVLSILDVRTSDVPCVWSPLLEGDFRRAEIQHFEDELWSESEALKWCRRCMKQGGFTHLIVAATIPRAPGYGYNGVDMEMELATELGLKVASDLNILEWG